LTISFAAAEPVQLDYVQKVDGGWVLTDENIIALANYIQELQDENTRLKAQVEALQKALDEERMLTDSLLAEKDRIIELQTKQIEDVKFVYENSKPSVFDKAYLVLGGAGIAATILLLARALQ
jgi:flagellar motility protein MotE (MotC chaperone)